MAQRTVIFSGAVGTTAGAEAFDGGALGDAATRNYVDIGGVRAVAFGDTAAGVGATSNTSGNLQSPATATALTIATFMTVTRAPTATGTGGIFEFVAPLNTSNAKVSNFMFNADRSVVGRVGAAGTTGVDTPMTPASTLLAVGTRYLVVFAALVDTATTGKTYGKVVDPATGTILYEQERTGVNNGTTAIGSVTIGRRATQTGTLAFHSGLVLDNTYNKALTPSGGTATPTPTGPTVVTNRGATLVRLGGVWR